MEHCCGQAVMVHADHANSWWGVELLIALLKHTKYYYFCELSMCRPMPTRGKYTTSSSIITTIIIEAGCPTILKLSAHYRSASFSSALLDKTWDETLVTFLFWGYNTRFFLDAKTVLGGFGMILVGRHPLQSIPTLGLREI